MQDQWSESVRSSTVRSCCVFASRESQHDLLLFFHLILEDWRKRMKSHESIDGIGSM